MERNKIIAVAALAVGIVALRTGAMQQEQLITLVTGDGKETLIEKKRALLFGTVRDFLADIKGESQEGSIIQVVGEIPTEAVLQAVIKDLSWVSKVRSEMKANETELQAARRIAKAMLPDPFDRNKLTLLISQLNAAIYLQQPTLVERYEKAIADMLTSDESIRRLVSGDDTILQEVKAGLPGDVLENCSHYIFKTYGIETMVFDKGDSTHLESILSASYSPDGSKVVTGSKDDTARIWNAATGRSEHKLAGHRHWVVSASFSPDGSKVVTASKDLTAKIWNAATGELEHTLKGHSHFVLSASFSPDGSKIVTASMDGTAKIWNAATGELEYTLDHPAGVVTASFSPDGSKIVTACDDHKIRIWNAASRAIEHTLASHTSWVIAALFSPDGSKIVSASSHDKTAKIWNAATGALEHTLGHPEGVRAVSFSPDGSKVVTACCEHQTLRGDLKINGNLRIWNASTAALEDTLAEGEGLCSDSLSYSPDGSKILKVLVGRRSEWGRAIVWTLLPRSLPGISDFDACLLDRLLIWANEKKQKISKQGWVGSILNGIEWTKVEDSLQKLIRENMAQ